jgi:hypothetical protein
VALASRLSAIAVACVALAACTHGDHVAKPTTTSSSQAQTKTTDVGRPRGGSVRVGVWDMPDPAAPTLAGAAVRALVLPQMFVAGPTGAWSPSLVDPGSDRLAADQLSASFRLRAGAVWSDGTPIGVDDLRRSANAQFVASVDEPTDAGRITVHFKEKLPGWRRLWSGVDSVAAPAPGVWGGPFVVASVTPGLETVLRRNDRWWGAPRPWLDEVRLVLVPEATMQRQLFEQKALDVVAPLASSNRRNQFDGEKVGQAGGWAVWLLVKDDDAVGRGLAATVPRKLFVETLLAEEATVGEGTEPTGDLGALRGQTVQLTGEVEEPMLSSLQRAMQRKVVAVGGTLELRNAESDRVEGWVAAGDYQAAVVTWYQSPEPCGVCGPSVPAGIVVPLWRPLPFVASVPSVQGVEANPWALGPAWNASEWWLLAGTP